MIFSANFFTLDNGIKILNLLCDTILIVKKLLILVVVSVSLFEILGGSVRLEFALKKAAKFIARISLASPDLQKLIEYMEYFSSWYAPVTPAPLPLKNSLVPSVAVAERLNDVSSAGRNVPCFLVPPVMSLHRIGTAFLGVAKDQA